jgi:hypothetical protein
MQICFQNNYSSPLSAAVMWYDPDGCGGDGGGWGTAGWWNLSPGQSVATNVFTSDGNFAVYAEAEDGEVWAGSYGPVSCVWQAFEGCQGIGNTNDTLSLGMRLIQAGTGHSSCTVHFDA